MIKRMWAFVALCLWVPLAQSHTQGIIEAWGPLPSELQVGIPAGKDFVQITIGSRHAVALRANGTLAAWGTDVFGSVSNTPAGNNFVAVSAGSFHTLALKRDGTLVSWGWDLAGAVSGTPAGTGYRGISSGSTHSLAIRSDGSIAAWGEDSVHQVSGIPADGVFYEVSASTWCDLGLRSDGSLIAWGGDFPVRNQTPEIGQYRQISSGYLFAAAIRYDGTIACWGSTQMTNSTPQGGGFVKLGLSHTTEQAIALRANGTLAAWGNDAFGQISATPTGNDYIAVASGPSVFMAIHLPRTSDIIDDIEDTVMSFDPSVFIGPTSTSATGRRGAILNKIASIRALIELGQIESAILEIKSLLLKLDGLPNPGDWISDGPEKNELRSQLEDLLDLLQ